MLTFNLFVKNLEAKFIECKVLLLTHSIFRSIFYL